MIKLNQKDCILKASEFIESDTNKKIRFYSNSNIMLEEIIEEDTNKIKFLPGAIITNKIIEQD